MISKTDIKRIIISRIDHLSNSIRHIEDLSKYFSVDKKDNQIYIASVAQKKVLQELLEEIFRK